MDWDAFAEGHLDAAHEVLTTLRPGIEAVASGMALLCSSNITTSSMASWESARAWVISWG